MKRVLENLISSLWLINSDILVLLVLVGSIRHHCLMDIAMGHLLLIGETTSLAWFTYLGIGAHFKVLLRGPANL